MRIHPIRLQTQIFNNYKNEKRADFAKIIAKSALKFLEF